MTIQSVSARRGFSLIELMIATAVLSIGLLALIRIHTATAKGVADGTATATANDIANQTAEFIETLDPAEIPACAGTMPTSCVGAGRTAFAPDLGTAGGYACTRWVDSAQVPGSATPAHTQFRVDTVVAAHPDAIRQPGAQVVNVAVCWRDSGGALHEVTTQGLVVPGT